VGAATTTAVGCGEEGTAAAVSTAGSSGGLAGKGGTAGVGAGAGGGGGGGGKGSKEISMGALMAAKPREGAEEEVF
jgi:hypothetical protein